MTFTRPASIGTYRTKVTRVVASNRAWDGVTPANAFLRKPAKKPTKTPAVAAAAGSSQPHAREYSASSQSTEGS